jgi:guanine deaminase
MTTQETHALRGQVLRFKADPFVVGPDDAVEFFADGLIVISNGNIQAVGDAGQLLLQLPEKVSITQYRDDLIMAGFIDTHVHYPQTEVIASYGTQLIEWLDKYTFPAEMKFSDKDYAKAAAQFFVQECFRNGVTTASVYCTVHRHSVDAFFEAAGAYNLRMIAGKVLMDRNAPVGLRDTALLAYEESKALIEQWHGKGRALYAITPRFAPTSSPAQLEAAGTLWREHRGTYMQTHVSENHAEIEWVKQLYPKSQDYIGVYEQYGLLGPRMILGHGIYLSKREKAVVAETGSAIAHCPTSNLFIGSGLFDIKAAQSGENKMLTGLASDIGGGSSFSMFHTMKAAYEVAQLRGYSLHPVAAYYLASLGSAKALYLDDKIGNLDAGFEADLIVIDLNSTPLIQERMKHAQTLEEVLFAQMILADDRAIKATYVSGALVYARSDANSSEVGHGP